MNVLMLRIKKVNIKGGDGKINCATPKPINKPQLIGLLRSILEVMALVSATFFRRE